MIDRDASSDTLTSSKPPEYPVIVTINASSSQVGTSVRERIQETWRLLASIGVILILITGSGSSACILHDVHGCFWILHVLPRSIIMIKELNRCV